MEGNVVMGNLTEWLTDPREGVGIHFAEDDGTWTFVPYTELAVSARRIAAGLADQGVQPGDVVSLVMPSGKDLLTTIFGVWAAGATISPISPPMFESEDDYLAHVSAILGQAEPALVVTVDYLQPLLSRATPTGGAPVATWIAAEASEPLAVRPPAELALLQFTSGSTGTPRGVRITWDNLAANFESYRWWGQGDHGDGVASWLPLHHDMGLIGVMLFPVTNQDNVWLMRPDQFIRDPARWLECFAPGRARHSAAPSFALGYAARKIKPERLATLDLSGLRSIIIGGETVDPTAMARFAAFAEPAGFSPSAFLPAYGLAENTLAVTSTGRGRSIHLVRLDWSAVRFGEPVPIEQTAIFGEIDIASDAGWMVGHGLPSSEVGIGVRVADDEGTSLPDGVLGEIVVTGTSMAKGYHRDLEGQSSAFRDGELFTGDAGFVHGNDLYVIGRMGDSIKLRGRSLYAEDLDVKVAAATGLHRGQLVVVGTVEAGRPGVLVFAAAEPGPWAEQAHRFLRSELGSEPEITVVAGDQGLIRRTSSGKPRRRHMWRLFREGTLGGAVLTPAEG